MLFSEIYGSYFNVLASVLKEAIAGTLTKKRVAEIAEEHAFGESALRITDALETGEWPFLRGDFVTPVRNTPTMPLTTLQKRWMKALLDDPRVKLFDPPAEGLEDVEPLYSQDVFEYFDRYEDGDPYGDEGYAARFRLILSAVKDRRKVRIVFHGGKGKEHSWVCVPHRLEYSSKDDKFRLEITMPSKKANREFSTAKINLARIRSCEIVKTPAPDEGHKPVRETATLTLELTDERNALERAMLHFSHLEKETRRLDDNRYAITLRYDRDDETEMLIRVLSFGPKVRVTSPESFIEKIRERLKKQRALRNR
jgi:hypothetical protein